ncbi:hypothetical protein [Corynebacterium sp. 335C]
MTDQGRNGGYGGGGGQGDDWSLPGDGYDDRDFGYGAYGDAGRGPAGYGPSDPGHTQAIPSYGDDRGYPGGQGGRGYAGGQAGPGYGGYGDAPRGGWDGGYAAGAGAGAGRGAANPAEPGRPGGGTAMKVLLGVLAVVVLALVGVVVFLLSDRSGDDGATAAPQATEEVVTETATATSTTTDAPEEPAPAPEGSTDSSDGRFRASPGHYGVGLNTWKNCARGSAAAVLTGTETTSCPFATNVGHELAGVPVSDSGATVQAHSPVTGKTYTMDCRRARDAEKDPVWKCSGGDNAIVYVYP